MRKAIMSGIITALTFASPVQTNASEVGGSSLCERFTPEDTPGPRNIEQYREYLAECHGISVREF
jgi:hypothetical protein